MAPSGDPLEGGPKDTAQNPRVFLDIAIDGRGAGRLTIELFADVVPRTADNFRALCTGERGLGRVTRKRLCYKGTKFYRIVDDFVAQGGDFSEGNGFGGESIYGRKFEDENFQLKHDKRGLLSMANSGQNSNGSLFFITFKAVPDLDGKHVVFGRVVQGMNLLHEIEGAGSRNGKPSREIEVVDCGELTNLNTNDKILANKGQGSVKAGTAYGYPRSTTSR